jgi:C4-dicarboxylate-specific signal transduction histidine kinase
MVIQRIHPDDLAYVLETYEKVKAGLKELDYHHRLLLPDGAVKHLHVIGHALEDSNDGVKFVGALMDVTAAKHAEEALHEAQAQLAHVTRLMTLGELAASIAHEVNQPLAAIVTNGEAGLRWLAHETPQVGETRRILKQIVRDAGRAGEVIRRIRNLSKKSTTQKTQIDINEAIGEVMPLVQREAANDRVALRLDLTPVLPKVLGDRVQLQQVIINLTINGIESMRDVADRPRQLVIRSKSHGEDRVLVEVVDAGTGIDNELADRLFNAFFTTKSHGLGMGLSIVRSIIEAHGGRVWASPNDEHGTTFQFTLPSQAGQVA